MIVLTVNSHNAFRAEQLYTFLIALVLMDTLSAINVILNTMNRRCRMYSPKIKEEYVVALYQMKQKVRKPITHLANAAIKEFLEKHQQQIERNIDGRNKNLPGRTAA